MILPDVNVLVYAHRQDARQHERYADWLAGVLVGQDEVALVESVLTGFIRVVTHPRIFDEPATNQEALAFVDALRAARRAVPIVASDAAWQHLSQLAAGDDGIRGNLVPDAWIAALARANGCRVATADRGFARFPGVDFFDPAPA